MSKDIGQILNDFDDKLSDYTDSIQDLEEKWCQKNREQKNKAESALTSFFKEEIAKAKYSGYREGLLDFLEVANTKGTLNEAENDLQVDLSTLDEQCSVLDLGKRKELGLEGKI